MMLLRRDRRRSAPPGIGFLVLGFVSTCVAACGGPGAITLDAAPTDATDFDGLVPDAPELDGASLDGPGHDGPGLDGPADAAPASCPPPSASRLTGAFMTYYPGYGQTADGWARELDAMRRACLDLVIWQSAAWLDVNPGEHVVYYPDPSLDSAVEALGDDGSHVISTLLDAAAARGMQVMLGLGNPWSGDWTDDVIRTEGLLDAVATDLVLAYGDHAAFGGLYITIELSLNRLWLDPIYRSRAFALYTHLVETVRSLETSGPIRLAAAPYYAVHAGPLEGLLIPIGASAMGGIVRELVDAAPVDVLMIQDGVGVEHAELVNDGDATTDPEIADYFGAAAAALADHELATGRAVELWNDVELFAHTGHDWSSELPVLYSADIGRVSQQIRVTASLVTRAVSYEWGHYVAAATYAEPNRVAARKLLEHLVDRYSLAFVNWAKGADYVVLPSPAAAYPDEGGTLTDGISAYAGSYENPGWTGWDSVPVTVAIDLGALRQVRRASAHVLTDAGASIAYPIVTTVTWSANGADWYDGGTAGPMSVGQGDWPRGATERAVVSLDAEARFIRFSFQPAGWLFVSELEVLGP